MDGLEITELKLSQLEAGRRIDAELYKKIYLATDKILRGKEHVILDDLAQTIKKGIFDISSARYSDEGIPFVRITNLRQMTIAENAIIYIPEAEHQGNLDTALRRNDIVLSKTAYPAASLVTVEECNVSQDTVAIRVKKDSCLDSHYAVTFLNTRYGLIQMRRWFTGNIQMHLNLTDCKKMMIPVYSVGFQEALTRKFEHAISAKRASRALFADADNLLLKKLGFTGFVPPATGVAMKSFRESFATTGRLDSEYYHPKFDYAVEKLDELKPKAIVPLGSLLEDITNGQTPLRHDLSEGDVIFLTAEHVSDFRIDFDSDKRVEIGHHQKQLAKTAIKKNDLLITIKGKIGNAAVVEDVPSPTNINQDVGLLRLKDGIDPYYIAGYINSILGKMFTKRISTGQINPFLGLGNLRTIPIPIFDNANELGALIRAKVMDAEKAASKSKHLLTTAKRAVEIAIEQNEDAAMKFVRQNS